MPFVVEFATADLERLETTDPGAGGHGKPLVRAYRKTLNLIRAAQDERDFRGLKGLRFERLRGPRQHQYSMRLNDQWRLIVEIRDGPPKTIVMVSIEDYH